MEIHGKLEGLQAGRVRWMFQESKQEDVNPEKAMAWGQGWEEEPL